MLGMVKIWCLYFFLSKLVKTSKTEQKRLRVKVGKRPLFSIFSLQSIFFWSRATRKPREVQTHSESIQDPLRTFYPRIDCILLFPNEATCFSSLRSIVGYNICSSLQPACRRTAHLFCHSNTKKWWNQINTNTQKQ